MDVIGWNALKKKTKYPSKFPKESKMTMIPSKWHRYPHNLQDDEIIVQKSLK